MRKPATVALDAQTSLSSMTPMRRTKERPTSFRGREAISQSPVPHITSWKRPEPDSTGLTQQRLNKTPI